MSSFELVQTEIRNPRSDLFIAFMAGFKFNCDVCKETGEQLLCVCYKCKKYLHPSCAGVETGTVYSTDGTKQVVLPASEKLPKSCLDCLREMANVMINKLYVQQRNSDLATSSSSITRYIESGMEPPHKIKEGDDKYMVHTNKPSHNWISKDNGTIFECSGCKMKSFGPHYACRNDSCSFILHEECKSPLKFTKHPFFLGLTFSFSGLHNTSYNSKKAHINVFCNACGMNVNGYYYHSLDGMNNLHPCCINLPRQTICGESGAKMVLQGKITSKCDYCHKISVKVGNKSTYHVWSYVAESEDYHFHVGCMIKMLSHLKDQDSMGRLISCKMTSKYGVAKMNLKIALLQAKTTCERKFNIFVKYAKIALGVIIAALLGDATILIVNSAMALRSN